MRPTRAPGPRPEEDARLLRQAGLAVAAQVAAAVTVLVLLMTGAVLFVDEHQQHMQADRIARGAWATADDVRDPPASTWLIIRSGDGRRTVTPGAPAAVSGIDPAALPDGPTRLVRQDRELVAWSGNRPAGRVSAVFDLAPRKAERRRLVVSLLASAILGVLGAALLGWVIGRRAVRPLGHALALQRRFVADASHELRTPLAVLHLRAQMIRRHLTPDVPERRAAELDRLVQDARVLGDVVTDLLVSAELGHSGVDGDPVDLAAVTADVVESLRPLATQKAVSLALAGNPDGHETVAGSATALRRAITSLTDNALAHTPPGGHVAVGCEHRGPDVAVVVEDDGEGLDPTAVDRLFERFTRGTPDGGGRRFGLGLALVNEVARAHGGRLEVVGEPGRGARFTLLVPVPPGRTGL